MPERQQNIAVAGGGPVGSLLAIYLAKRGNNITVFERRPDMRTSDAERGRSINLALSNRGLRALREVGIADAVHKITIPMGGRIIHDATGNVTFSPYGQPGEYINSVSRSDLNILLMNEAERAGVKFQFDKRIASVDIRKTVLNVQHGDGSASANRFDYIIGADGAFSAIRSSLQISDRFDFSQHYIEHGYKEFHIPAGEHGSFRMERNGLHIWPRQSFMMIALPNPDGSFTATLFYPWKGFESLHSDKEVIQFMETFFPDFCRLAPDYFADYTANPVSSLVSVRCWPWMKNNTVLIGDAAHAIVPFYGQGMNAGFEDCRILNELLREHNDDWTRALPSFQTSRKPNADAIAQLAMDNFIEMRDLVADDDFRIRKKIEAKLHALYPRQWIPLYSMVTFRDDIPYSAAQATGRRQQTIMDRVMKTPLIRDQWEQLDFESIVKQLDVPAN